ncbi:hypothetical protein FOC1_g10012217 [Fusarium oxysporum f. sp. cubense race 1]|uniref:Gylcosyl hydrolase 115 C-terminal domain-containing protein n=1 Tax=Fusarium oxysporum f. sp. cubense (strain race 1) TaxID=1229664 RepID=N4U337_FUSC1|nr:hypothetical protein FOC1_g10012217 [Fusarium oxysporum f. sp. cubense race 1]
MTYFQNFLTTLLLFQCYQSFPGALAGFEETLVAFEPSIGAIEIQDAVILCDDSDPFGIAIAAGSLADDFEQITGTRPSVRAWAGNNSTTSEVKIASESAIIAATVDSPLMRQLESSRKLNLSSIRGKWETFETTLVAQPFPGVQNALVIAGSDMRAVIFGIFTLSEQSGQSPLYWWNDVPAKKHDKIYAVNKTLTFGEPTVKYRGIFINDEAPALTSWWAQRSHREDYTFDSEFYERVFDLLLRLRANLIWPAMWGSVRRAGGNDTYFTLGMRGENDGPIQADDPIAVLREVFAVQRNILASFYGNETAARQIWTIYKEVATYYESGLEPPEDVTLMFTDDNWGNVQKLPNTKELDRSGGIGMYYHFEYVGRPKSWKWQNSNNLPKIYKELFQAAQAGANRIWVFNVGDIKPVELPLNMAMDLAWNATRFDLDSLPDYLQSLAARDFDVEHSEVIASAWLAYSHLVGMRKFEMLEPTTYSITNYEEAHRILGAWKALADRVRAIEASLPQTHRDAFFHSSTYAAVAGYNYHAILIGQGKNRQYSFERRNSANAIAYDLIERFEYDHDLTIEYDAMADGKWRGIMSTPKFDMSTADWRPSSRDVMANLSFVQLRQDFDYAFGNLGIYVEQSRAPYLQGRICASINPSKPTKDGLSPMMRPMEPHGPAFRWIDLFHRGDHRRPISWSISVPEPWINVSQVSGEVSGSKPEERVHISINWELVPATYNQTVQLRVFYGPPAHFDDVHLPVINIRAPKDFAGFPEVDGIISIEAPHYQRSSLTQDTGRNIGFKVMPRLASRSESGSVALRPYQAAIESESESKASWLEYDIFILGNATRPAVKATIYINGALDTRADKPMLCSLSLQNESKPANDFFKILGTPEKAGDTPPEWNTGQPQPS